MPAASHLKLTLGTLASVTLSPLCSPDVLCSLHSGDGDAVNHRDLFLHRRPCSLYQVTVPFSGCKNTASSSSQPESVCLTPGLPSAQNPTFSPDGDQLVFLSHAAAVNSGVHAATVALMSLPWSQGVLAWPHLHHMHPAAVDEQACITHMQTWFCLGSQALYCPDADLLWCLPADGLGKAEARTVVPVVQRTAAPEEFQGLYCGSLAQDAFLGEPTVLAISLPFPVPGIIWQD